MLYRAQTTLLRLVVDLLYNMLCNKFARYRSNGVWAYPISAQVISRFTVKVGLPFWGTLGMNGLNPFMSH